MMRDMGDCYRRLSNIFESFEIFLLPNIFQTHLYAGQGKGGQKSNWIQPVLHVLTVLTAATKYT